MEQQNASSEGTNEIAREPGVWRDEVQARVAGYRSRRGRRIEGAFSMRFPFPDSETATAAPEPEAAVADVVETDRVASAESSATEMNSLPTAAAPEAGFSPPVMTQPVAFVDAASDEPFEFTPPPPPPAPRPKRKVIAFPRPVIAELTYPPEEPLIPEQPRILDVQEELPNLPTTPLLDGLLFPSHQQQNEAAHADHVELPLQPVMISRRLYAGFVDCVLVGMAAAMFLAACFKLMPRLPLSKPLVLLAAAIPLLLWAAYQYLFLMYEGRTVGMRAAHLRLSTFKGTAPRRRQRRKRVLGLYFSTASLMMGLLWAMVDVDALCWHDRISGTYLVAE
jgi:uncharacterized RDD family membrane protein YckC